MKKTNTYTAKTLRGLEDVLAKELEHLGAHDIVVGRRIVHFKGDKALLYRCNLNLRTALTVLKPLFKFKFNNQDQFYKELYDSRWDRFMNLEQTFAIRSTVFSDLFPHTKFPALRMKDAIADWFRSAHNSRPNVNVEKPDILFDLHVSNNYATVSLDSSGESLHKRGYRLDGWKAPLNEVLASGLIALSGWNTRTEFIDPMCGSGTLAIEAAMRAANIPANYRRLAFGFHNWKDYDDTLWKSVFEESVNKINTKPNVLIKANDRIGTAMGICRKNATVAGVEQMIEFSTGDFSDVKPNAQKGVLLTNPPYGERVGAADLGRLYETLGDHLKSSYNGWDAWILSGNFEMMKKVGLRSNQKITIFNGKLETRFVKFELYQGSRKIKRTRFDNH
ncbi:MAG: THUMP domain-containing class I SAM-dependent RNA methyltransferase [Bacteroidia bacterium]